MSVATVICVERLSFASSSFGTFRVLLLTKSRSEMGAFDELNHEPFPTIGNVNATTNELHVLQLTDTQKHLVP